MPPTKRFKAGYARLKTVSGCLTCRRRRKKCDESKPICMACTRNDLLCTWPFEKSDGDSPALVLSILHHPPPSIKMQLAGIKTPLLEPELQSYIVNYTMNGYLPIQVHKYPGVDRIDQSHIVSMSFYCPALMDILLANGARTLDTYAAYWRSFEIASYIRAVRGVREILGKGDLESGDDSLLATLMWLSIFENSRLDSSCSQSGTHLAAFSMLLKLRVPVDRIQSSHASRTFERICVEYFIYHSTIITLFDPDISPATSVQQLQEKFQQCLNASKSPEPVVVQSPVLGSVPELFTTIIQLTERARRSSSSVPDSSSSIRSEYTGMVKWQRQLDEDAGRNAVMRGGKLYEIATRLLFLFIHISADEFQKSEFISEVTDAVSEGLQQLLIQPLGRVFGKYWLWPLAILGSVTTRIRDINLIRDKMDAIAQRSNCNGIKIIRYILESNWANNSNSGAMPYSLAGLAILLDGDTMKSTSALLLSYRDHTR